jgi:hypothetical protein
MHRPWNRPLVLFLVVAAALALRAGQARSQQPSQGQKLGHAAQFKDMRLVGHDDLQARSAYQPIIHEQRGRWVAYVGHHGGTARNPLTGQDEPNGTSIVDVTDPANPRYLFHIPGEAGVGEAGGAQMVQVCDGDVLPAGVRGKTYLLRTNGNRGHEVWDVTDPRNPTRVSVPTTGLNGTHKNWWDCESGLAYLVADGRPEGWRSNRILKVFDLSNPAAPRFIRNFGLPEMLPGATGPTPPGLHEPTFKGNRLYLAYGTSSNGVVQIVDKEKLVTGDPNDVMSPQVARLNMPPFWGGHTAWPVLRMPIMEYQDFRDGRTRDFLVVVSESVANMCQETHHIVFFLDITNESRPFPVANYQVPESAGDFCQRGGRFGAHSINWSYEPLFYKKMIFVSYFNAGVRAVDIRDPFHPREVAFFIPATTENTEERCATIGGAQVCKVAIQTNNVEVDNRGYIYLADRANTGLHIVELIGDARRIVTSR